MIKLTLPYPPTINHYYGNLKQGGKYIKPKGKIFRQSVWAQVLPLKHRVFIKPVSVDVQIFPPDRRKRDIDNINKALLDALEHAQIYANDNQIIKLSLVKHPFDGAGRVVVTVNELEGES